jgi:hypothetical protein
VSDYLPLVAAHFQVDPERVLVCRIEGDKLVVVVDRGILGCPKFRIPISKLTPDKPARTKGKAVKP